MAPIVSRTGVSPASAAMRVACLALLALRAAAQTPVPVRDEPLHKVVLENSYVRLLDVRIPPGGQTLYHVHRIPSVVVELTHSTIISHEMGQPMPAPRNVSPGETRYAPYDEKPLIHQVTNTGAETFHVMDIELLQPEAPLGPPETPPRPLAKLAWEHGSVRVYNIHLGAGDRCSFPPGPLARLLIAVSGSVRTGGSGQAAPGLNPGEYRFYPPRDGLEVSGGEPAECVLLELAGSESAARAIPDVAYLEAGRAERLDLYLPAAPPGAAPAPAVVWIHGGSFTAGDKAQPREKDFGTNLSAAGYAVASVNYRLGDGAWPQNIRDCKDAVRFLRAHAAEYRIDPARIAVAGGSAGAYLAMMVGFAGDEPPFDPGAAYPGVSDRVRAVIDFYGPADFLTRQSVGADGKPTGRPRAKPVDSPPVFNAKPGDTEIFRKASVVGFVTRDAPPVLICHGRADPEVDFLQAVELDEVLARNGVPHELHLLDGIGHSFDLETWRKQPLPIDLKSIVLSFLAKNLGHGETR